MCRSLARTLAGIAGRLLKTPAIFAQCNGGMTLLEISNPGRNYSLMCMVWLVDKFRRKASYSPSSHHHSICYLRHQSQPRVHASFSAGLIADTENNSQGPLLDTFRRPVTQILKMKLGITIVSVLALAFGTAAVPAPVLEARWDDVCEVDYGLICCTPTLCVSGPTTGECSESAGQLAYCCPSRFIPPGPAVRCHATSHRD